MSTVLAEPHCSRVGGTRYQAGFKYNPWYQDTHSFLEPLWGVSDLGASVEKLIPIPRLFKFILFFKRSIMQSNLCTTLIIYLIFKKFGFTS